MEREIEDLAALIAAAGGRASLFGHSSGGILALEATAQGLPVERLAVYEAPFVVVGLRPLPAEGKAERIRSLIAEERFCATSYAPSQAFVSSTGWAGSRYPH